MEVKELNTVEEMVFAFESWARFLMKTYKRTVSLGRWKEIGSITVKKEHKSEHSTSPSI
jgi:hypothetical protein